MQLELDHFFGHLHFFERVSKQAFSQARKNLSHRAFIELNQTLLEEFYRDNEYTLWKGFRLIGIDGSTLQLPTSPEIRAAFGTGCHDMKGMTFARISCAYDLLNDISLDAQITRYCHNKETRQQNLKLDERALTLQHIEYILQLDQAVGEQAFHQRDLFLFDMGYPSLDLIINLQKCGKDYVFRCSNSFLKEVRQAIEKGENDQQIQIPITSRGKRRPLSKNVRNVGENAALTLRVLLIPLDSGKSEILLTSLIEKNLFPYSDFKSLYAKRWGVETHFSVLKEHLEIENFTGLSVLSVKQDFFATILTNNFRGLIQQEAQAEIEQDHQKKPRKYAYKINTHLAIGCLKDQLVKILVLEQDITPFCNRLKSQIKKNIVPIRKNRHFLRKSRTRCKKYHITKKRVL